MNLLIVIVSAVADLVTGAVQVARPKRPEKPKTRRQRQQDLWLVGALIIGVALALTIFWLIRQGWGSR